MNTGDNMDIPKDFRYEHVLRMGKPVHEKYDRFSLRHPAMPLDKRAKIFSPFDALKGFSDAISSTEAEFGREGKECEPEEGLCGDDEQIYDDVKGTLPMCTRYYMDDASEEMAEYIMKARKTKLTESFMRKAARPIVSGGEVRPTDIAPVIAPNSERKPAVFPMQWGFRNPDHDFTVFNARCETAGTKPTFSEAWKSHRCIIPASYYFEWEHIKSTDGKVKTGAKYAIQPAGDDMTWLCGLYRMEDSLPHFVVLTRDPVGELAAIHDRMPLMMSRDMIDAWIDPDADPASLLSGALTDMIIEKM